VLRTNRALAALVSLQPISAKYRLLVTLTRVTNECVV